MNPIIKLSVQLDKTKEASVLLGKKGLITYHYRTFQLIHIIIHSYPLSSEKEVSLLLQGQALHLQDSISCPVLQRPFPLVHCIAS